MADATYNLGVNVSVGSVGVSSTLNAIEQRFQKFSKSVKASSQSMNASMKGSMSTIDAEMSKFDQLNTKMQKVSTGKEKVSKQAQKVEQTSKKEKKAVDNLGKTTDKHTKALKGNTNATENWLSSHTRSIGIAVRSTVVWGLATTAIYGSQRAMREMHQTMMDVNSEMVALRRVMNEATTDFDELRNTASDLGVDFAANVEDIVSSMVEWGRQGRSQVEVIELTEAALLATNVAQMDASQSVDLLTSALLQFNMEASESVAIIDRWNEVANNYAINATDIAMSVRESGAAARSAGISMDELIGMTTALSAATAKTGNRIGRSLRTVFSRMMGDMGDVGESVGKVEVALNSVGVSLRSSQNEYRNMTDVITDLAVTWDDLDDVMQANIARAIGGRRRYSDVIALIENWDMALDATQTSMGSLNSAIEENETYMESVEAQWTQVTAAFNRIINTLTEGGFENWSIAVANAIESVLNGLNNLIKGMQTLSDFLVAGGILAGGYAINAMFKTMALNSTAAYSAIATLNGATTFQTLLSAINPVYLAIAGLTVGFTNFVKEVGEAKNNIEEATKAKEEFAKITKEVDILTKTEIENSKELVTQYSKLATQTQNLIQNSNLLTTNDWGSYFSNLVKGIIPLVEDDMDKAIENMEQLSTIFPKIYKENRGDVEGFFKALQKELKSYNNSLENSVQWIIEDTDNMYENTMQGMRNVKMLQEKSKRYNELANMSDKTVSQEQEMIQIQEDLREQFYELATAESSFGDALSDLVDKEMVKFGDAGESVNKTIEELETSIDKLADKEDELEDAYKKQGDRLNTLNDEYQKLLTSEDSTAEQINNTQVALENARDKYESIGEALELTREKQLEYINNLEVLQGGLDDIDAGQFLSNFEGLIGILDEFTEKVTEVNNDLMDIGSQLENELDFELWLGDVLDRDKTEQLEAEIGIIESYFSDVEGMVREIATLNPRDFATGQELSDYIEEEFNVSPEKLDLNIDDVFEAWNEGEFEDAQEFGKSLALDFFNAYQSTLEGKKEDLSAVELFNDVMETEDLYTATEEELKELDQIFKDYKSGDLDNTLLKLYTDEEFSNFLKIIQNADKVLQLRKDEANRRSNIAENIRIMDEQLEKEKEIRDNLSGMIEEEMTEYEQSLQEVNKKLETLDTLQNQAYLDPNIPSRIAEIKQELEGEKEVLEALVGLEGTGAFDIIEEFQDFNIADVTSMDEASDRMDTLKEDLESFKDTLSSFGLEDDQIEEALNMLGLDEDTIDGVFEEIRGKIYSLEEAWYNSMADAISNAVEQFTDDMSFGDKFGILLRESLSSAFDNLPEDEIRSQFNKVGSWIGDSLNLGENFGEAFGDFAMSAGQVYAQGGSIGQSLASGIGTVLTGSPVIGQAIGSIGQSIFGGVEGRDEMEAAKKINEQLSEAENALMDFGIFFDAQYASFEDTAGSLQSLFGGEDWDVDGLGQAKIDLEDMEEILERVGKTAQDIFGQLPGLLSEGLSYHDFKSSFEESIGQAMQDAIIQKLLETQAIESQIQQIAGMVEMAIGSEGQVYEDRLDAVQEQIDRVVERAGYINEVVKDLDLGVDDGGADVTMDRSFRAGSTSTITYHNTFAVQSQIFLDDTSAAREAAKKLAPYIQEYLERHT